MDQPAAPGERLHALDALRAFAMLLGIVLHAIASFVTTAMPWPVDDPQYPFAYDAILYVIHGFRMPLFFFLSGFFAHLLVQRDGVRGFARQRAVRIGVPFLAGMLLVVPLALLVWSRTDPPVFDWMLRPRGTGIVDIPTAHLWFLEVLLVLSALAIAGHSLMARAPERWMKRLDAAWDWLLPRWFKPLLLALPTAALLWFGPRMPEIDDAGASLLPGWQTVAYYALFFTTGWWTHRRQHLLDSLRRWVPLSFALAALAFLACGEAMRQIAEGRVDATTGKLLACGSVAVYNWAATFALTGVFLHVAAARRTWVRYLADASYWWYLWHLLPVMVLQAVVAPWPAPKWLKLLVILAGTVAVLWPSYHFLVQYTWVGRILNGPRRRPPRAPLPAATA